MTQDMASRLREAREKAGYSSARQAAEAMGIPAATYIQHENGTRGYPIKTAQRYARFFRTTPEWLLYGRAIPAAVEVAALGPQIRLIGTVAGGLWRETDFHDFDQEPEVTFTGRAGIDTPLDQRFGLRVVGDSMDLVFPDGTILECVTYWGDRPIENGRFVIVQRRRGDGTTETTVKEYMRDDDGVEWLIPNSRNPAFQAPFRVDDPGPGIEQIAVIALVVSSTRFW